MLCYIYVKRSGQCRHSAVWQPNAGGGFGSYFWSDGAQALITTPAPLDVRNDSISSSSAVPSSSSEEASSSSLEEGESSSSENEGYSSSSEESEQCRVHISPLLKNAGDYDDGWVYLGKEAYVTTTERRNSPMFPGRHFDVLGRVYQSDKLPDRHHYYYIDGNKIYKPRTVDVYSEFEVWRKFIKDADGNDAQVFRKEDKERD